jgi:type II secretory pathway component GspD/PulD (secretin)
MQHIPFTCALATTVFVLLAPVQAKSENATATAQPASAVQAAPAAKTNAAPATVRVLEENADKNETLVSIAFDETPLVDVIKAFRDATGANIISMGTNLQGTVSVRLDNVPWRKGLSSILNPQGLELLESPPGSGIFVVSAKTTVIPKVTRTFKLANAKADEVSKLFTSTIGKEGTATPFPAANVVIVTATELQLSECEKIITTIDVPRTQVYIEARFAELTASASKKLGMKWDSLSGWKVGVSNLKGGMEYNKGKLASYDQGTQSVIDGPSGSTWVEDYLVPGTINDAEGAGRSANSMSWKRARGVGGQLSAGDFSLTMSAFEEIDGVSIFSNPKIIVANEESATVDMTTKEPNVEVSATRSGTSSDQLDITTKLTVIPGKEEPFVGEAFFSYGISLKVTPRVSSSGTITVQIEPSISDKDTTKGGDSDGNNMGYFVVSGSDDTPTAKYPIIKVSRLKTVFTLQDGSTAVIGGLSRTTEANVDSGIPGLRSLPWIGPRLFGWKSREKGQKEIVIFVTVGIADPTNLKQDVGMPKNAVLGRELLTGKMKEPGDRTKEDLMSLDDPKETRESKDSKTGATTSSADKPAQISAPASEEPLLKNP